MSAETMRHIGDYRITDDPGASDVTIHIDRAEQFVSTAEQFLSNQTRIS
jgi:hypothetical protein